MKRLVVSSILSIVLAGCGSSPKAGSGSGSGSTRIPSTIDAMSAAAPQAIPELTDQTRIFVCPTCQMEYDRAGQCPMDKVALVETRVDYICPADDKAVTHAGKCPRCAANARIEKTAMAVQVPGGK